MSTPNNGTYYVRRDVGQPESRTAGITNKVLEAGVQTSYVHSSIKLLALSESMRQYTFVQFAIYGSADDVLTST